MARVGRLAGALLAESGGQYFLIGNTKEPCDFVAAGFEPPGEPVDALVRPWVRLGATREIALRAPVLAVELEGEALAARLAESFLIERNGSVSERLWQIVSAAGEDARWLGVVPPSIWRIVRDAVLKCS